MRKMLRLVSGYLRHNLMSAMAYRGAFLLQVIGMLLNDAMLLFFWWILFSRLPSLRGWDLPRVMTLYGVVAFGFGAATIVCGNAFNVARIIVRGDLDFYLTLPADPLTHLLVSRMSLPAWGDMLFGLLVFLAAAPGQWKQLPLFLLLGLLAGLFSFTELTTMLTVADFLPIFWLLAAVIACLSDSVRCAVPALSAQPDLRRSGEDALQRVGVCHRNEHRLPGPDRR